MLFLICTPIGNLNDFSLRSIITLQEADKIYAEDTRAAAKLFKFHDIKKKSFSFHEHNEVNLISEIMLSLSSGKKIAIVSDAGAPLISDPGYPLVQKCIENNIPYTVLPGPSSVINAVMLAGLPTNKFLFHGFLPRKYDAKIKVAENLNGTGLTHIFFESAKRLEKTIEAFIEILDSSTRVAVCKEMTKEHESVFRGSLHEIHMLLKNKKINLLGEFVVAIYSELSAKQDTNLDEIFCKPFLDYLSPSDASKLIAKIINLPKQDIYKYLVEISK